MKVSKKISVKAKGCKLSALINHFSCNLCTGNVHIEQYIIDRYGYV